MNPSKLAVVSFYFLLTTLGLSGCSFKNTQIRTVDAAKAQFDNGSFAMGSTTKDQVKTRLGSPNEINKLEGGKEQWVYIKTVEEGLFTVTTDVGTHYVAEYTFDASGTLSDMSYRATPMGNPLLRH